MTERLILNRLSLARRVADHACALGIRGAMPVQRTICEHLGAALADAVLQAGLNYSNVVRVRIERIQRYFPETAQMSGLFAVIDRGDAAELLLWRHPIKIERFVSLARSLAAQDIESTIDLREWLGRAGAREQLLRLHGVGPKTIDYLCGLVGLDFVAVDRHIMTFAREAGVEVTGYDALKAVMSCAADLLDMARRDFDSWVWRTISTRELRGAAMAS